MAGRPLMKGKGTAKSKSTKSAPVAPVAVAPDGRVSEYATAEDKCPICKSDRYLNPKLRLLVSTKCFHRLCEGCIDRIFTLGPEPCPICGVELRKNGFMAQTYEDLKVEKEVSIRKRISRCFNKRQHDFPDLQTYNNYLEEVEDITFNLINSVDVQATEARIKSYQQANAALIAQNQRLDSTESSAARSAEAREHAERAAKRKLIAELEEKEAAARVEQDQEFMASLENASDGKEAAMLLRKSKKEAERKRKEMQEIPEEWARLMGPSSLLPEDENMDGEKELVMEDPLSDLVTWYDCSGMYDIPDLDEGYALDPWTHFKPEEEDFRLANIAAGYRAEEVWDRALRSAVMGLFNRPAGWADVAMATA